MENQTLTTDKQNEKRNEIQTYIKLGIKHNIFQKMTGMKEWRNIGFIIKNEMEDEGIHLYLSISQIFEKDKYNEIESTNYFSLLNKSILPDTKKSLSLNTLLKYFKDTDKEIAKKITKEAKENLHIKEFNIYELPESNEEFDTEIMKLFNVDYMNNIKNDYQKQKKYFELFVCKVLRPSVQFVYIESDKKDIGKDLCFYTENDIIKAFKHIQTETEDKTQQFINVWLIDPKLRCYNSVEFIPFNSKNQIGTNKHFFNLFQGYNKLISSDYNKENTDKILKPFMDLGLELCGGNQEHFNYFLKWLAHIIQKPNEKIAVAVIIKGKQGTGKNMFLDAYGNLLGKNHYISSSKPNDFFGEYAEGFYHKLLVNMNECEGKDTFDFEGKMKSFVSEDTITINPKNVRPIQISNVARLLIFTNKPNPITIDVKSKDRRYTVFQTTDKFLDAKYGTQFWRALKEHFNRPEFISCLYDYFNTLDIEKVDWRTERPITKAYRDMCKLYSPVEALFFEEYLNQFQQNYEITEKNEDWITEQKPLLKSVYDEYVRFCKSSGFTSEKSYQPNISKFHNRLTELEIPYRMIQSNGYRELRFIPNDIIKHLTMRKWINYEEDEEEIKTDDVGEYFEFQI